MFNNGLSIRVKGGPFEEPHIFNNLFKSNDRVTIIYGRNGSGKTTLSNAIMEYSSDNYELFESVELLDENEKKYIIKDEKKNIQVFNELFINNKIRFKEIGLDTIVLLGEDLKLDKELEKIENEDSEIIGEITKINIENEKNISEKNTAQDYNKKIEKNLKNDNGWAARLRDINTNKNKAAVTEEIKEKIYEYKDKKYDNVTLKEFNTKLQEFKKINENNNNEPLEELEPVKKLDIDSINLKLNQYNAKSLSGDLAIEIINTFEKYGLQRINEIQLFLNSKTNTCPYCFQKTEKNHKDKVLSGLNTIINNKLRETINSLNNIKIAQYNNELPDIIDINLRKEYEKFLKHYNDEINVIVGLIDSKKSFPMKNVRVNIEDYNYNYKNLSKVIKQINKEINDYNTRLKNIKKAKEELIDLNNAIAWNDIKADYTKMQKCKKQEINNLNNLEKLNEKREKLKQRKSLLESKKSNVDNAIEEINANLEIVFLSKNRMRLVYDDETKKYKVKIKKKSINLERLSTGERNIISLCYFLTSIGENKSEKKRLKDEYLVVIDDPISSFDIENIIGVYSLLRKKLSELLTSNNKTKILLLTHSYYSAYNIDKIISDIKDNNSLKSINKKSVEINNFKLNELKDEFSRGKSQYKKTFMRIYEYINNDEIENDETIGNEIRKVLEMYSSFVYAGKMEELKKYIPEEKKYLQNYMYRILLNNESHGMIYAYSYDEIDFFSRLDHDEKIKFAKVVIIMMYVINRNHVINMLDDTTYEKGKIIQKWDKEIENSES